MQFHYLRKGRAYFIGTLFLLSFSVSNAQVKWDGEAGDGQWNTAANWVGNTVPGNIDEVLLDNSFVSGNYNVHLPSGSATVSVKRISITPESDNEIQLILPSTSLAIPALTVTGPGYGLIIDNGGTFQNSSGATAGNALVVSDSIRVNNGGQYIHNTRSAHASLVSSLSRIAGTEAGVFKFDVPGGGYAVSIANRVYGILIFSAVASEGVQSYTAISASTLTIQSDLVINIGVSLSFDITSNVIIHRNYIQNGGVFNIASQPNSNTVFIGGNLIQNGGTITESSAGLPIIELNGTSTQSISIAGGILNSITLRVNNPSGISMLGNILLPYKLDLSNGIVFTNTFLLTLLPGCNIIADSSTDKSFISGSMRKEGLLVTDHFLFPIGKANTQRWLELKNVSGNYTVEFFKSDPRDPSNSMEAGVDHISSIEYWTIIPDAFPNAIANVELSFNDVNSGGVTDLTKLLVAQLVGSTWTNKGNTATTGAAGSSGSVVSYAINFNGSASNFFTLASADPLQNPLPNKMVSFVGQTSGSGILFKWEISQDWFPSSFELQSSNDGIHFNVVNIVNTIVGQFAYQYLFEKQSKLPSFYRLKITEREGTIFYSHSLVINRINTAIHIKIVQTEGNSNPFLLADMPYQSRLSIVMVDAVGRQVWKIFADTKEGINHIGLSIPGLPGGVYWLMITDDMNLKKNIAYLKLN